MVENKVQMPGVFGGLMRYEFESKFMFSPTSVMGFIVALILFVIAIKIFFPL